MVFEYQQVQRANAQRLKEHSVFCKSLVADLNKTYKEQLKVLQDEFNELKERLKNDYDHLKNQLESEIAEKRQELVDASNQALDLVRKNKTKDNDKKAINSTPKKTTPKVKRKIETDEISTISKSKRFKSSNSIRFQENLSDVSSDSSFKSIKPNHQDNKTNKRKFEGLETKKGNIEPDYSSEIKNQKSILISISDEAERIKKNFSGHSRHVESDARKIESDKIKTNSTLEKFMSSISTNLIEEILSDDSSVSSSESSDINNQKSTLISFSDEAEKMDKNYSFFENND